MSFTLDFAKIMNYFSAANTMEILLALLIFVVIFIMVKMSLNPSDEFDLKDLVSTNGHVDSNKFTRFGAWVVSTWGFVYLLVNKPENFPEWYFAVYMGAWVANTIFDKYMNTSKPNMYRSQDPYPAPPFGSQSYPQQPPPPER